MAIKIVEIDLKQIGPPKQARVTLAQTNVPDKTKMRPDSYLKSAEKAEKNQLVRMQSERIRKQVERALQDKPNFILFPELSIPWEMQDELRKTAAKAGVYIIGGLTYGPDYYNACAVFPPFKSFKLPLQYKLNPAYVAGEDKNVKAGPRKIFVFKNTGFGSFATVICYDFTSLDISKDLRDHSVNILFLPTLNKRVHLFDAMAIGKCYTMYTYICLCNAAGSLLGNSASYGPVYKNKEGVLTERQILAKITGNQETTLKADLDIPGLLESIEMATHKKAVLTGFISPPADLQAPGVLMQACAKGIAASFSQSKCRVLVVGDVMLDHVIYGHKAKFREVLRHGLNEVYLQESLLTDKNAQIRPEDSSPETFSPGGAAWLAMALSEVAEVSLLGLMGSKHTSALQSTKLSEEPDFEGKRLIETLADRVNFKFILTNESPTICKNYFYYEFRGEPGRYSGIRMDREDGKTMKKEVEESFESSIIATCKKLLKDQQPDAIVIDDYEKGMITGSVVEEIANAAQDIPLFIDPKYDWDKFRDIKVQAILPNTKELLFGLGLDDQGVQHFLSRKAGLKTSEFQKEIMAYDLKRLLNEKIDEVVVKADQHGSTVLFKGVDDALKHWFINPLKTKYVTGVCCGGVYDSFYVASRITGNDPLTSAMLANFASGLRTRYQPGRSISVVEVKNEIDGNLSYFQGALEAEEIWNMT